MYINSYFISNALSAFTRDVAGEFILDKTYNTLDLEDFNAKLTGVFQRAGSRWRISKHFAWFHPMTESWSSASVAKLVH